MEKKKVIGIETILPSDYLTDYIKMHQNVDLCNMEAT